MVLLEYLPQSRARAGARRLLIGDAAANKGAPDLVVQILAVGHDDLTFRTLFRPSDAIFEEPRVESGAGALYRPFYAL